MLWPPPARGERVVLRCSCRATILWRLPVVFIYLIRFTHHDHGCSDAGHAPGRRALVALERIVSRDEPHSSAPAPV
jgi:hypothetical protein